MNTHRAKFKSLVFRAFLALRWGIPASMLIALAYSNFTCEPFVPQMSFLIIKECAQ